MRRPPRRLREVHAAGGIAARCAPAAALHGSSRHENYKDQRDHVPFASALRTARGHAPRPLQRHAGSGALVHGSPEGRAMAMQGPPAETVAARVRLQAVVKPQACHPLVERIREKRTLGNTTHVSATQSMPSISCGTAVRIAREVQLRRMTASPSHTPGPVLVCEPTSPARARRNI